ncbi:hypothetical protein [Palleronia salina]|nr:hypothetical protein [Palleronia salina]
MQNIMFEFGGEPEKYPDFDIIVNAADRYPLYSQLGRLARLPVSATKRVREDGSTYIDREGLVVDPETFGLFWKRYSYPDTPSAGGRPATWLRGEPTVDGVDAILKCEQDDEWGHTRCGVTKKDEPVFYKIQISGANPAPDAIANIELLADLFVSCLKNGFTDV